MKMEMSLSGRPGQGSPPYAILLGITQDDGFPGTGCRGECCHKALGNPEMRRFPACLGICDPESGNCWMIDCTPNFPQQLRMLGGLSPSAGIPHLGGIFLTHAHIGHYLGLAHLGHEAMGAKGVDVYALPRMAKFLKENAPWQQLISKGNIDIHLMEPGAPVKLSSSIEIKALPVPHRDEYSETAAFLVNGPAKTALYLPDIDSWSQWEINLNELIEQIDLAFLDGTFYSDGELPGRDMSEIPHPRVLDTMDLLASLPGEHRAKVRFFHFNHTNPLLDPAGSETARVRELGFGIASEMESFLL